MTVRLAPLVSQARAVLLFAAVAAMIGLTGGSVAGTPVASASVTAAGFAVFRRSPSTVTGAVAIDIVAYGLYLGDSTAGIAVHAAIAAILFLAATVAYDAADPIQDARLLTVPSALVGVLALTGLVAVVLRTARPNVGASIGGGWLAGSAALLVLATIAALVRHALPRA